MEEGEILDAQIIVDVGLRFTNVLIRHQVLLRIIQSFSDRDLVPHVSFALFLSLRQFR